MPFVDASKADQSLVDQAMDRFGDVDAPVMPVVFNSNVVAGAVTRASRSENVQPDEKSYSDVPSGCVQIRSVVGSSWSL